MASCPITSWQIEEKTVEMVTDFILRGYKITADSDYSHEIKRFLLLLESIIQDQELTVAQMRKSF